MFFESNLSQTPVNNFSVILLLSKKNKESFQLKKKKRKLIFRVDLIFLRNLEKEMVKIHDNLVIFYGFLGS
jgi:hypothetical protein